MNSLEAEPDGPEPATDAAGWGPVADEPAPSDIHASGGHAIESHGRAGHANSVTPNAYSAASPSTLGKKPEPAAPPESMGLLHDTAIGKVVLSAMLLATSLGLAAWNMPDNFVRDEVRDRLEAPVNLTGLNQGWEVFAPNPPRTHVVMTARITYDDGSTAEFGFPEGEPFLGAFREYRWRKWERRLRLSDNAGFRAQSADWIAREMETPGKRVTEVMLVRTRARTPTIGSGDKLEWKTTDVYQRTFSENGRPRGKTLD